MMIQHNAILEIFEISEYNPKFNEGAIVIADNYFDKTQKNILGGSKGSILIRMRKKKETEAIYLSKKVSRSDIA